MINSMMPKRCMTSAKVFRSNLRYISSTEMHQIRIEAQSKQTLKTVMKINDV